MQKQKGKTRNRKLLTWKGGVTWLALILMVVTFTACESRKTPKEMGSTMVKVGLLNLSSSDIARIEVTVSGENISPDIVVEMTKVGEEWSGTIDNIVAGTDRTFVANAFDAMGTIIYSGTATGVTITDTEIASVSIFLTQTVLPNAFFNSVPRFSSLVVSSLNVTPNEEVSLSAVATDPDGDSLVYAWSSSSGTFSDSSTSSTTWTAPNTEGIYQLTVSATDPENASASISFDINVQGVILTTGSAGLGFNINTSPEIEGLTASPTRIDVSESTFLDLTAIDPDGDALVYVWTSNCMGDFNDMYIEDPIFTLSADNLGADCVLFVSITDDRGGSNTAYISIVTGPEITVQEGEGEENPSSSGELLWAKSAGSSGYDRGEGIVTLSDGSSVVTGNYASIITFGIGEINETTLASTEMGASNIFIAKYNPDGTLSWVKSVNSEMNNYSAGISAFADGSFVITGSINGNVVFGRGEINETTLSGGMYTAYIAKYNPDGTLQWAKITSGDMNGGAGVSTLADGSSVITGGFMESIGLGLGEANQTTLSSVYGHGIYIAKYNADGTLQWAKSADSDGGSGMGISTFTDGSSVVTGFFSGTIVFGTGEINETTLASNGTDDTFIAKYNVDGALMWAKSAGGHGSDFGRGITTLSDDSSVVTGYFSETVTFGAGEINEITLASNVGYNVFIAKYNVDGALMWAKSAGGNNNSYSYGISALTDNSFAITGAFYETITFGAGETNETGLTSNGGTDTFVAKYNVDGTVMWVKSAGGNSNDYNYGISALTDGSCITAGAFETTTTFGTGEINETTFTSVGYNDIFIAKFAP